MHWLILLLLVPVILVPMVMLCGFAGCGTLLELVDETPAPTEFTATAGTNKIDLAWKHTSATAKFTVQRTAPLPSVKIADQIMAFSVPDTALNDGTDFAYSLTATDGGAVESFAVTVQATTLPNPPTNLTATPEAVDKIKLKWNHVTKSTKNVKFIVNDTLGPGAIVVLPANATPVDATTFTSVQAVAAGSKHQYQIAAEVARFDDSPTSPRKVDSDLSTPPVPGEPLPGNPVAFQAAPGTSTNQPGVQGFCIVQLISQALLQGGGTTVKITLRGTDPARPNPGPLTIDRIYISQVDHLPGKDPYDPLASGPSGLMKVVNIDPPFSDQPVKLAPGESKTLTVAYTLVQTEVLLIAFDINPTAGQGNVRFSTQSGAVSYSKGPPSPGQAVTEAALPDRTPGYIPANNNLYLIEKIEVS